MRGSNFDQTAPKYFISLPGHARLWFIPLKWARLLDSYIVSKVLCPSLSFICACRHTHTQSTIISFCVCVIVLVSNSRLLCSFRRDGERENFFFIRFRCRLCPTTGPVLTTSEKEIKSNDREYIVESEQVDSTEFLCCGVNNLFFECPWLEWTFRSAVYTHTHARRAVYNAECLHQSFSAKGRNGPADKSTTGEFRERRRCIHIWPCWIL